MSTQVLLSLASKQIWPQVLTTCHLKPAELVLLHSNNDNESRLPAQRLKKFFAKHGTVERGNIHTELLSGSDFSEINTQLESLIKSHQWNPQNCILNITGGNKLMAIAAFQWAARKKIRTFYLERENQISWFDFHDGKIITSSELLDGHIANDLNPVDLLRCQLDASEVEREGETLTLNSPGANLESIDFFKQIQNGITPTAFLNIEGIADTDKKKGDNLELLTAAILLKLGIKTIQRSLRLKVKSAKGIGTQNPHAEIDLLFSWNGKLWLVDCKDRKSPESLIEGFQRETQRTHLSQQAKELLERIKKELSIGQTKAIKEDLLAIRETGGLLGKVVCVRKAAFSEEAHQYATHNNIEVIQKSELVPRWKSLLFPNRPADQDQLSDLAKVFQR